MISDPFVIYHGGHAVENQVKLKAGGLWLIYESGNLRYISSGNAEILRMIYSAVRDQEWLTINPQISHEVFDINPDSFIIKYKCHYCSGEIEFLADFLIEGNPDNSLTFSFEGKALTTFKKSRIGFCILHPVKECAGKNCIVHHSGGTSETLLFPEIISPDQPFTDIRAMTWNVEGLKCRIDFEGDIFETEDQRNWTDASYKTYCTPLDLPAPATVRKGERISQKVTLRVDGKFGEPADGETINFRIFPENVKDLPMIGIGRSTRPEPLSINEIIMLRNLEFDHYRVDLFLFENDWKTRASSAVSEAKELGYALELALFFDDDAVTQCAGLIDWFSDTHTNIYLISIYHRTEQSTPDILTDAVSPLLRTAFPGVKIAIGTNANFAELNRERPETAQNDFICYSVHPQEHASDNSTLTENLAGQGDTVRSAAGFANGKGIWISPVNIQRRFNSNTSNYEVPSATGDFPPQVDSRLMSLFGACWTVGSLKYLYESGVKGITFFETAGERGIIQGDYDSRWPDKFPATMGMIFPVFFIFRYLAGIREMKIIKSLSSSPLCVDCLAFTDGRQIRMIAANFTSETWQVFLAGCTGMLRIRELNAGNYSEAANNYLWTGEKKEKSLDCTEKLRVEPYSISFIEGWLK